MGLERGKGAGGGRGIMFKNRICSYFPICLIKKDPFGQTIKPYHH